MIAANVFEDTVSHKDFEHFLKWHLLPRMNPYPAVNSILVCDNAKIHKGGRINQLCNEKGIKVIYLPPYCPELNPIELCFSIVKSHLCQSQVLVTSRDNIHSIYKITGKLITASLCEQLYHHAGYPCSDFPPCFSSSSYSAITTREKRS